MIVPSEAAHVGLKQMWENNYHEASFKKKQYKHMFYTAIYNVISKYKCVIYIHSSATEINTYLQMLVYHTNHLKAIKTHCILSKLNWACGELPHSGFSLSDRASAHTRHTGNVASSS
jgi:hypothetical protein